MPAWTTAGLARSCCRSSFFEAWSASASSPPRTKPSSNAKTVRYGRGVYADGRIKDPDVQEALQIRMASVTGGGYPSAQRQLAPERRQEILDRDRGLCQICGHPGDEIDHIAGPVDGDINHPGNLQVLCAGCHRQKTMSNHRIATDPEHIARAQELHRRIHAAGAQRPCDDPTTWANAQRQLTAARRSDFCDNLERLSTAALGPRPDPGR